MSILLKDILKEVTTDTTTDSPLKVQIYCDMDGVLANLDKGFKAISGGYSPENFKDKFNGDKKAAQREFWKVIHKKPDFWISLEPLPDSHVLWKYLVTNFTDLKPVILTAGQGASIKEQKTEWAHKHFSPDVQVILAASGTKKPEHIINPPQQGNQYITHVLIDDTEKNIQAWDNQALHRIAIHHKNAADTIKALKPFITK